METKTKDTFIPEKAIDMTDKMKSILKDIEDNISVKNSKQNFIIKCCCDC